MHVLGTKVTACELGNFGQFLHSLGLHFFVCKVCVCWGEGSPHVPFQVLFQFNNELTCTALGTGLTHGKHCYCCWSYSIWIWARHS